MTTTPEDMDFQAGASLSEFILSQRERYIAVTGKPPLVLYLSRQHYQMLQAYLWASQQLTKQSKSLSEHFAGMIIRIVDHPVVGS